LTIESAGDARLFVALWPTPQVLHDLDAHQAQWAWPAGAALTGADQLHLTLHFIGAVPVPRIAELVQGLRVGAAPFTLELDSSELWPNQCAVLCPSQAPAALAALHDALAQALRALALKVDARPLRPHVTLAHRARGATPPTRAAALHWPVRGYALVRSSAGRYTPIAHYP
jgi:RNA 2',3'-cyclic 3'-phosphodiesterase